MLWAKTRMCFRGKGEGWITQWVVLVLVNTPLPRTEGYACWGCGGDKCLLYNPTHPQLVPTRRTPMSSKKEHRCVPIQTAGAFCLHKSCTILPIFQGAAQKVFPKPRLLFAVPTCSLSFLPFNFQSSCLALVALTSIMAGYRMSFLSTRVLVDTEAGLCPDIPPTKEKRRSQHNLNMNL